MRLKLIVVILVEKCGEYKAACHCSDKMMLPKELFGYNSLLKKYDASLCQPSRLCL
jgi:hypothetical protein